ncbi:MAG: twin-arginine translocase subunit TatC [Gammaproteobacteria bacterium]|nr:twin-arginine translocase subunit TatC [Gammaproteobacteria bacterium]
MSQENLDEGEEQAFISHLVELRNRLIKVIVFVLLVFIALSLIKENIYTFVADPLLKHLPKNATMIATEVASPFFTPFKLALVAAVFLCVPYILYHFWAFIAPGLYRHEQRLILPLLIASTLLFFAGVAFAYYVVFPMVFGFLSAAAPSGVTMMTDIGNYLDFVIAMFFAFGICFEVPIFTVVLVLTGIVTPATLAEQRPYVIVGVFIIGMFLTPPDVVSQTMLAIPMWLLFEIGLLFSRLFARNANEKTALPQKRN